MKWRLSVSACTAQVKRLVCLSFVFAVTYDVCTERSEGMGPAHVQMGRVEPLEEANVVKTLRLQNLDKTLLCRRKSGSDEYGRKEVTEEEPRTEGLPYYLFP